MKNLFTFLIAILFFWSLISCKTTNLEINNQPDFIANKNIGIDFHSVLTPNSRVSSKLSAKGTLTNNDVINSISVASNSQIFIKFKGDSITGFLPFYRKGSGKTSSNNLGTMQFEDIPKDFTMEYNARKNRTEIEFNIKQINSDEILNAKIYIHDKGNSLLNISSSERNTIQYFGKAKSLSRTTKKYELETGKH